MSHLSEGNITANKFPDSNTDGTKYIHFCLDIEDII